MGNTKQKLSIIFVSIDDLLPIEDADEVGRKMIGDKPTLEVLEEDFDWNKLDPIPIVEYKGKYILGDGHHRSWYLHSKGIKKVPVKILKTVEDMANCNEGVFRLREFRSMSQFYLYYRFRRLYCKRNGINKIGDYDPKMEV